MEVDPAKLRRARKDAFLTQVELGERAGVTEMTVSRLERGVAPARICTVRKLAQALGVHPSEILANRGEEHR